MLLRFPQRPSPHTWPQAGLLSAVSTAFIIDVLSRLDPKDPSEKSEVLLRGIHNTLERIANLIEDTTTLAEGAATLVEDPSDPPPGDSPTVITLTVGWLGVSLAASLGAALLAMLEKQQLDWYLLSRSGLTIGHCRDRQQKCDKLRSFSPFSISPPSHLLLYSLLLLASGLCARISHLLTLGTIFIIYPATGVAMYCWCSARSIKLPFRIPVSIASRSSWKKVKSHIAASFCTVVAAGRSLYKRLPPVPMGRRSPNSPLPMVRPASQEPTSWLAHLHSLLESIQRKISRVVHLPSSNSTVTPPWLTPTALAALREANATDVRCVTWALWRTDDPEELDIAIRRAGTIRWFEDGLNAKPPYELIVSTFEASFDTAGKISPGSRDRAYYSGRAILWIHVRAMCIFEEFALEYPLPTISCDTTSIDDDLKDLFEVYHGLDKTPGTFAWVYTALPQVTPTHQRWVWDALLHTSWARRRVPGTFGPIISLQDWSTIPSDVLFDRLLTWCIFLGCPVDAGNTVDTVGADNVVDVGNAVDADNAVDAENAGNAAGADNAIDVDNVVDAGDAVDAVDEVVLRVRNKSCVVSYFCPPSYPYRCFQRSLGADHISVVTSHRLGHPHRPPSMRSPPRHVARLISVGTASQLLDGGGIRMVFRDMRELPQTCGWKNPPLPLFGNWLPSHGTPSTHG